MMNYKLYQIKCNEDTMRYCFSDKEELLHFGMTFPPPRELYSLAYQGSCEGFSLNQIWYDLNQNHPADYKARSLSKSDVLVYELPGGQELALFCDSIDFLAIRFKDNETADIVTEFVPRELHDEILLTENGGTIHIGVEAFLGHLKVFKGPDGKAVKLDPTQIYAALLCFYNESAKYRYKKDKDALHTLEEWTASGMPGFDWYAKPGDLVDEEIYMNFLNILPPAKQTYGYLQVGEATDHIGGKPTYLTFTEAENGNWRYRGHCFYGESENRKQFKTFEQHFIELLD